MRFPWWLSLFLLLGPAAAEAGRPRDRPEKVRRGRKYSVEAPTIPEMQLSVEDDIERAFAPLKEWFGQVSKVTPDIPKLEIPELQLRSTQDSSWTWNWFGNPQTRQSPEVRSRPETRSRSRTSYRSSTLGRPSDRQGGRDRGTMMPESGRGRRPSRPRVETSRAWSTVPYRNPVRTWHNPGSYQTSFTNQWRDAYGSRRDTRGYGVGSRYGGGVPGRGVSTHWWMTHSGRHGSFNFGGVTGGNGRGGSWSWSYSSAPTIPRPNFDAFRNMLFQRQHRPYMARPSHPTYQYQNTRPSTHHSTPDPASDSTYETVCRGHHYEARRYNTSVWVSAMVRNGSSMDALRRIKAYFMGENDRGLVLKMSRPLRMTVWSVNGTISDTEDTIEDFILSAMVPTEFQGNPPSPADASLNITVEPAHIFFAISIRPARRPGTPAIYDEFFELQYALDTAGELFERGTFHTAFYEAWSDIILGSLPSRPRPGEILIPGDPVESSLACGVEETAEGHGWQNGIEQCGHSRCPEYERLELLREDIELRRIGSGTYVTRTAPACSIVLPAFVSHCALKRYVSGANAEFRTYPSPAPFLHYIYPSPSAACFCKQTATSGYMLPAGQVAAQPTQSDLRIRTLPAREAYVMKFRGRPTQRTVEKKVDELRRFLRRDDRCFIRDRYLIAIYDHPFSRPPHLNEVMVFRRQGGCRENDLNVEMVDDAPSTSTYPTSTQSLTSTTPMTERMKTTPTMPTTTTDLWEIDVTTDEMTTSDGVKMSTTDSLPTEFPSLIEVPLSLETNSLQDADLIPYRFNGNNTDFPEDFPTDVFVF